MLPERERIVQFSRLIGLAAFVERFGSPQTAAPEPAELRALVDERLDEVAQALVAEAAASDDVTDVESARAYLEDRIETLGDLLSLEQAERIRTSFGERTRGW